MSIATSKGPLIAAFVVAIAVVAYTQGGNDPRSEICRILTVLGYDKSPGDLREQQTSLGTRSFVVVLPGIVGEALCVTGGATGRIIISTGRYVQAARGEGRTSARKWASLSAAQAYTDAKATAILRGPWRRRSITLGQNAAGSGGVGDVHRPGRLTARYVNLYSGYPFVDRFVGCTLLLDSQDGALVEYHGGCSPVPVREAVPGTLLTEQQARDRIQVLRGRTTFDSPDHELGWAVPPGKTKAVLTHRLSRGLFVVSAPNGEYWEKG